MKTLRTRKNDSKVPVGNLFFSIRKTNQRSVRYRNSNDYLKNDTITDFLTNINNTIQNDIKDSFYKIPITLITLKRKFSKKLRVKYYKMETYWT